MSLPGGQVGDVKVFLEEGQCGMKEHGFWLKTVLASDLAFTSYCEIHRNGNSFDPQFTHL